ncbi:hypothetical protein LCGC14_1013000 [marine sediment metagenome]|uniref:Uncharacterized protein n=1 Tax=marine sediment metagenome TaxID=412755 RepID=A0A0F9NL83_9ZZZZ|nr:hypothetical protein [bacterium]
MDELINLILDKLKNLDVPRNKIKNEEEFEDFVYNMLEILIDNYDRSILLKRQQTSNRETRQLKPDIIVGLNDILIELKYDIQNLNDIYRLFYQAVKYSRIANELLIIFVFDPQRKLTREDIQDLKRNKNVSVVRIV